VDDGDCDSNRLVVGCPRNSKHRVSQQYRLYRPDLIVSVAASEANNVSAVEEDNMIDCENLALMVERNDSSRRLMTISERKNLDPNGRAVTTTASVAVGLVFMDVPLLLSSSVGCGGQCVGRFTSSTDLFGWEKRKSPQPQPTALLAEGALERSRRTYS
jgi:hypothetical protein